MLDREEALSLLRVYGQEHVLKWYEGLNQAQQQDLLSQIESLDLKWLKRTFDSKLAAIDPATIRPFTETIRQNHAQLEEACSEGQEALRAGKVATLLVAGGHGTRLGFDGPKGAFPIGAVSGHTLYQIHVERLIALGRRYGVIPPLYVMTSDSNHEGTCELFAGSKNFGFPADRLMIFEQGLAPAVDETGKLLMNAPHRIVRTPNGNGGLFLALEQQGAFSHMHALGVDTISYIQVDNPLSRSCDPVFVGYHLLRESQYSCKAIKKIGPQEKVGCYALVEGKLRIVEYNELPLELARATDDQGELLYGYSNPGFFLWSREFARAQALRKDLPFHKAYKKIPHLSPEGQLIKPQSPCGYKFESFAMDTLPDAERSLVLSCDRNAEFAPVKNAEGTDSPATARAFMNQLFSSWVEQAGGTIENPSVQIEISPLYALDAQQVKERLPRGFTVNDDLFLGEKSED